MSCRIVALVEPGATRPCYLNRNHGGEHRFILRGQIVDSEGKPLAQKFTQDESPEILTKASGQQPDKRRQA